MWYFSYLLIIYLIRIGWFLRCRSYWCWWDELRGLAYSWVLSIETLSDGILILRVLQPFKYCRRCSTSLYKCRVHLGFAGSGLTCLLVSGILFAQENFRLWETSRCWMVGYFELSSPRISPTLSRCTQAWWCSIFSGIRQNNWCILTKKNHKLKQLTLKFTESNQPVEAMLN